MFITSPSGKKLCSQWVCDPLCLPVTMVLKFLTTLYRNGLGYSTINSARSAISAVVLMPGNTTIWSHPLVTRFLKGIFEVKTPRPRDSSMWNVADLWNYFKTLGHSSELLLKELIMKLSALLLLVSAQLVSWYFEPSQPQWITSGLKQTAICLLFIMHTSHQTKNPQETTKSIRGVQTIHLINVDCIQFCDDGCTIYTSEKLEHTWPGFYQHKAGLPKCTENEQLCFVSCLEGYIYNIQQN